jgi:hypothetical protein
MSIAIKNSALAELGVNPEVPKPFLHTGSIVPGFEAFVFRSPGFGIECRTDVVRKNIWLSGIA